MLRRQAFFHTSVGCCICRLEIKSHFKSLIQPTRVELRFPIGSVCQLSQLTRVKLCFSIGSACSMSQMTRGKLCIPFGSTCNKSNVFAFRLIVNFIQKFQSRMQQDLVDLSLSNAFSIAELDSISIKAKSNSAILINLPKSQ